MNSSECSDKSLPKKAKIDDFISLLSISSDPQNFVSINQTENLLKKPVCIGEFSHDDSRRLLFGRSRANYFYEPALGNCNKTKICTNLTQGYDKFKNEKPENDGLLLLTRWILSMSAQNSSLKKTIHECEFVIWRGTITRLMFSCYESGPYAVGIKVACCKFKGIYFIREYDTKAKTKNENLRNDYEQRMGYAGHKFEQIVTVGNLNMRPCTSQPLDLNSAFIGIFKATLNPPSNLTCSNTNSQIFHLFYGAEIDCISPSSGQHLELKTQYKNIGFGKGFSSKALKWWIQSYLAGIKQLVIGLHENLKLNRVDLIDVNSLVKYFSLNDFKPTCCFAFLYLFLQTIKSYLDQAIEGDILIAERLPNSNEFNFQLLKLDSDLANNYSVICDEFKAHGWQ